MDELSLNTTQEASAAVRCSTIPHQRNNGFFGRSVELEDVTAAFDQQSKIRPVVLWGSGGIGKSQIAIEFAHRRWESGTSVILWIASETTAEIASSFNDAARNLNLGGYSENNTPDKNRHLVLQWLQSTSESRSTAYRGGEQMLTESETDWLLIFDNVEDEEVLSANLPKVGQGDILITCRSELLVESLETSMAIVEVPPFSNDETTQLILQILNKTPTSVKDDELQATRTLSEQLGGLPLAVDIVARNMKMSPGFKSVVDFLPYYEKNRHLINKREGSRKLACAKDLDTVWQIAFESLDTEAQPEADAAKLLSLLCFVAPEAIAEFFQPEGLNFPEEWSLLGDDERFENAQFKLRDMSLIKINAETGLMSIHRLIQQAYFDRIPHDLRCSAFQMMFQLLRKAYPVREGKTHLYRRWAKCQQLEQHVQAIHRRYKSLKKDGLDEAGYEYRQLIRDNAWFLLEIQRYTGAEELLLDLIPEIEEGSIEYADSTQDLMGIYERTGRSNKAVTCAKTELDIFLNQESPDENGLANVYSDVGYTLCSAFKAKEALSYLDKAIEIAKEFPDHVRHKKFNMDRFLRNHARIQQQLGNFADALNDLDEAEIYQQKMHGRGSHYDGETKHERAKILAWQGDLEAALDLSIEACRLVSQGKPTHASVGAAHYRQGWILQLKGDLDTALLHFEKTLAICQINEPYRGNKGESARVQWRIAQIFAAKGRLEDARILREAAEETKRTLHSTGDYAIVADEDASWDTLLGLLYR